MSPQRRLAAVVVLMAFLSVACLSLEPPQARFSAPRPTATVTPPPSPTPTASAQTPTPTSTATPTITPSPTATATLPEFGGPILIAQPSPTGPGVPTGFPGLGPGDGLLPPVPGPGAADGAAAGVRASPTPVSWACNGDERMDFIPPAPVVGDDVYITVVSSRGHGYLQLQGPLPFDKVGEGQGGPGYYYWQWKKKVDKPGTYTFEFYSGPRDEFRCVMGTFQAFSSAAPTATATPRVAPTPTPSHTPRPDH